MLDKRKVKLMTKLALEEKKYSKDLNISKYYKNDYIRYNMLKTIISVTIAYICIIVLYIMYNLEKLIAQILYYDFTSAALYISIGYVIIIAIYVVSSYFIYSFKYKRSKSILSKYYRKLKILNKIYENNKPEV